MKGGVRRFLCVALWLLLDLFFGFCWFAVVFGDTFVMTSPEGKMVREREEGREKGRQG